MECHRFAPRLLRPLPSEGNAPQGTSFHWDGRSTAANTNVVHFLPRRLRVSPVSYRAKPSKPCSANMAAVRSTSSRRKMPGSSSASSRSERAILPPGLVILASVAAEACRSLGGTYIHTALSMMKSNIACRTWRRSGRPSCIQWTPLPRCSARAMEIRVEDGSTAVTL